MASSSPPGSPLLSPQSKIRALLATVDSSSESESESQEKQSLPKPPVASRSHARASSGSDDDSNDDILRPRGKLAARMLAEEVQPSPDPAGDARERVRKLLQSPQPKNAQPTPADGDDADEEDEDEDEPQTRKPKQRPQRRDTTPDPTPDPPPAPSPGLFVSSPAGSPGLFVSPAKSAADAPDSDSDVDLPNVKNARFAALVARKRKERLAREAEEQRKKEARLAAQQAAAPVDDDDDDDSEDGDGGRKLTQGARPPRKASKKALEEMNRETQRLSRNMQLAHEAKTRKKIPKSALFERFNYKPPGQAVDPKLSSSSRPTSPDSAAQHTDAAKDAETPPSSPPLAKDSNGEATVEEPPVDAPALPTLTHTEPPPKGKATAKKIRVKVPLADQQVSLSDDELSVLPPGRSNVDAILRRAPLHKTAESRSLHALRILAHLDDPERRQTATGITSGELQASLRQRARQQARVERERRVEFLRSKGVHVATGEEREREAAQVEDMVARAKEEAEEIMRREREAAKKERREGDDPLAWDDSDDSYEEEVQEVELSGSEDEEEEEEGEEEGEEEEGAKDKDAAPGLAEPGSELEDAISGTVDSDDDIPVPARRRPRKHATILDDDDSPTVQATPIKATPVEATPRPKAPSAPRTASPKDPGSVLRSATKPFIPGVSVAGPAGLGLTQIFAGTLDDDSQAVPGGVSPSQPMPSFGLDYGYPSQDDAEDAMILDSQPGRQSEVQDVHVRFSQLNSTTTQASEFVDPTQDEGFRTFTPLKQRFVDDPAPPASTISTVAAGSQDEPLCESPLAQRTGKLWRRVAADPAEGDEEEGAELDEFGFGTSAFTKLQDAALHEKRRKRFDKKKSKARDMVEDQAEESEDEYAGVGGADGEDSSEDDGSVDEMIDDEARGDDDAKLAAFYADRERASDEKQVEKLFHDITSGMLRRKRHGGDYDLDDSDDDGEARRRMKRRQFAKMQRALLADERVSRVAENPRTQAFLRTIEDRGSDDESGGAGDDDDMGFLFAQPSSSSQSQSATIPDSQPSTTAPKTSRRDRSVRGKKPSTLGEIRTSLSNLLGEADTGGGAIDVDVDVDSDGDDNDNGSEQSSKENRNPRRRDAGAVVDRLTLKRKASSSLSDGPANSRRRLAFAPSSSTGPSFKVPTLLRRATANSIASGSTISSSGGSNSNNDGGSSVAADKGSTSLRAAAGEEGGSKIRRGATRGSGINYFARENERRAAAAAAEGERRREARRRKGAEGRGRAVRGLFGGGKFE